MTAPLRGRVGAVTGLADRCRHRRAPASARSLFTGLKAQKWAKGGGMICDVAFPAITLSPKIFQAVRCHTGVAGRTDGEPRRLQGNRALPRAERHSVDGRSASSRWVYSWAGWSRTWSTGPCSTMTPSERTTTSWAMLRTTARLWVMKTIDRPRST